MRESLTEERIERLFFLLSLYYYDDTLVRYTMVKTRRKRRQREKHQPREEGERMTIKKTEKTKKRSKNDSENEEALKAAEVRIYASSSAFVVKNNFSALCEFEFCFESCLSENERHFQRET